MGSVVSCEYAFGGGAEESPRVGPRCTDGKDGHKKWKGWCM